MSACLYRVVAAAGWVAVTIGSASGETPPDPIDIEIARREVHCHVQGGTHTIEPGFLRRANLGGEGREYLILDDGKARCSHGPPAWCGSGGCSVTVFVRAKNGRLRSLVGRVGQGYTLVQLASGMELTIHQRHPYPSRVYRFVNGCVLEMEGDGAIEGSRKC